MATLAHIDPPVSLEDETHLLLQLRHEGRLPNVTPQETWSDGRDPLEAILHLTEKIKALRTICDEQMENCARASQDTDALFASTSHGLDSLVMTGLWRMRFLRDNICGQNAELGGNKAYTLLQYIYHDLGHDYLLAIKLHNLASERGQFLTSTTAELIRARIACLRAAWRKRRSHLMHKLEHLHVEKALAFMRQLDDKPPNFTHSHSDRVPGHCPAGDHVGVPYVPSPWKHMLDRAKDARSQAASAAGGPPTSSKTAQAAGGQDDWDTLDGAEWEDVSSDVPLGGEEFELFENI